MTSIATKHKHCFDCDRPLTTEERDDYAVRCAICLEPHLEKMAKTYPAVDCSDPKFFPSARRLVEEGS